MTLTERADSQQQPRLARLAQRWPTFAGVVFGASLTVALWFGFADSTDAADILTAAGFVYLGAAALRHRAAAWPLFALTFVLIGVGFLVPGFDPHWWMLGLAAALVIYGLIRGALRPPWGMPLQTAALALIVAIAIVAAFADQPWAGLLAGAGLLAHAGWDIFHHRTGRVVAPTMAEFCAALDIVLGVAVIAIAFVH